MKKEITPLTPKEIEYAKWSRDQYKETVHHYLDTATIHETSINRLIACFFEDGKKGNIIIKHVIRRMNFAAKHAAILSLLKEQMKDDYEQNFEMLMRMKKIYNTRNLLAHSHSIFTRAELKKQNRKRIMVFLDPYSENLFINLKDAADDFYSVVLFHSPLSELEEKIKNRHK